MSDLVPKPAITRKTGLSPKEQKLQAMREKLAAQSIPGNKPTAAPGSNNIKSRTSFTGKKTAFQRKAT
jgi:hypothetical protein